MSLYAIAAAMAGCLWGCTGYFTRILTKLGLSALEMLIVRYGIASACFGIPLVLQGGDGFRVKWKDAWLFAAIGILGQLCYSYFYYSAINMMSVSTACILLYLSPALVTVMARIVFHDPIGVRGMTALVCCVTGSAFASGLGGTVTGKGLLYGLGAAIAFSFVHIIERALLERGYSGKTINFYLCFLAAVGAGILCPWMHMGGLGHCLAIMSGSVSVSVTYLTTGIFTGFFPYLLLGYALTSLKSGKVSVLTCTEPVAATLSSIFIFHEPFGMLNVIGIAFVLGGIMIMSSGGEHAGK